MPLTTLYLDLNSYFASVEQQEQPHLRNRPMAVVPFIADTTCCLAASIEAKRLGIRTGTLIRDARRLCPSIALVESRPRLYVQYHHRIIEAIETCIPIRGVHSIDEVSCRLQPSERTPEAARELALRIKAQIRARIGEAVRCSIGIAPNRFLAKVATDMQKPDGFVVIRPEDLPNRLYDLALTDLPGIGKRMNERLDRHGVRTVEHLCALDARELERIWESVVGKVWWHWLRGDDLPEPKPKRRSIGHQHVLPPHERTPDGARAVTVRLLNKAAARLRHLGSGASKLTVWIRYMDPDRMNRSYLPGTHPSNAHPPNARQSNTGPRYGSPKRRLTWSADVALPVGTSDTLTMLDALGRLWASRPASDLTPLSVGVTLHDLVASEEAVGALYPEEAKRRALASAVDKLDAKFGRHTVYPASMHNARTSAKGGIAFQSIPDLDLPDTLDATDDHDPSDVDDMDHESTRRPPKPKPQQKPQQKPHPKQRPKP